jgi:hypothetical protein
LELGVPRGDAVPEGNVDPINTDLKLEHIIQRGRTYDFEQLPKLLWVSTGERLPDPNSFEKLRKARNAIQHFCSPTHTEDLRRLALEFLYKNIDPLINRHFGLCAVEHHEDTSVGYDYVVECVIRNELLFSIPSDFKITEIDLNEALSGTSGKYQKDLSKRFAAKGLDLVRLRRR